MIDGFAEPPVYLGGDDMLMRTRTLEALAKVSGRELTEWIEDGGASGKARALVFMELAERHLGADPGELWEAAADVAFSFQAPPPLDPTDGPPS